MMRRKLGIAIAASALCFGCGDDAANSTDNSSTQNSTSNQTPNNTANNTANNTTANNTAMTGPWGLTLTGIDEELGLLTSVNGNVITIQMTPMGTNFSGVSSVGVALNIGVAGDSADYELNTPYPAATFAIGFTQDVDAECVSDDVMVTFTRLEPTAAGTFAGSVTCGLTPIDDGGPTYDGTVSGRFDK